MKNLLVTGRPGVGKTTLIRKLASRPLPCKTAGFFTQEIRERGERTGFSLKTLDGKCGLLASVHLQEGPRVGRYRVNVGDLDRIAVPCIEASLAEPGLLIIDEIGKMELFSQRFREAVMKAFDSSKRVIATVKLGDRGFTGRLSKRDDTKVLHLTESNRDSVMDALSEFAQRQEAYG